MDNVVDKHKDQLHGISFNDQLQKVYSTTQTFTKKFQIISRLTSDRLQLQLKLINPFGSFGSFGSSLDHITFTTVILILLIQALFAQTVALCPTRCECNEDSLHVSCIDSNLDLVPILLNPDLLQLNLTNNRITNLHYTLNFYNNLNILDLSHNKIQTLGSMNFESQHQLHVLNISNNQVKNISKDTFKGLQQLQILDFSYNQLQLIMTNAFVDLHNIQILNLNHNNLLSFEESVFSSSPKLTHLYLTSNQLLEIPYNLISFTPNLKHFELAHNLIEQIDLVIDLEYLEYLNFNSNMISNISSNAFDSLYNLKYLDFTDNNLNSVPTEQMSKLTNLTILKLSGNFIEVIPTLAFQNLFQLKYLYMNRMTRLTSIDSRAFIDNIHLESIQIDSNTQLTVIPTRMFHSLKYLTHITIRDNVFETLAPDHFPLDQLQTLKISGQQFICNCSLLWLWKLLQLQDPTVQVQVHAIHADHLHALQIDGRKIVCTLPPELSKIPLINVRESDVTCSKDWATVIIAMILVLFVITVIASVISYAKRYKCLPSRPAMQSVVNSHSHAHAHGHHRHGHVTRGHSNSIGSGTDHMTISGPSQVYGHGHGHHSPPLPPLPPPNNLHRPKLNMTPTHWDISFQEQYSQSDYHHTHPHQTSTNTPQTQIKNKPPHIVFV